MENQDLGNNTTNIVKSALEIWKGQLDAQNKINKLEIENNLQLNETRLEYTSKLLRRNSLYKVIFVCVAIVSLCVCAYILPEIPSSIITFVSLIAGYFLRDSDTSVFLSFKDKHKDNGSNTISE